MSPKMLIFPLVLAVTLDCLTMHTTSQAIGKPAVVHITNAMPTSNLPHVDMKIRVVGGDFLPPVSLSAGQEYQLQAMKNSSYISMALFGLKFAVFNPYASGRDKGQAAVYWKVNDEGFYIGYDGSKWKFDTAWESE